MVTPCAQAQSVFYANQAYEARLEQWNQAQNSEILLNQVDTPFPEQQEASLRVSDNKASLFDRVTQSLLNRPAKPKPYQGGIIRHKKGAKSVPATNPQLKRAKQAL